MNTKTFLQPFGLAICIVAGSAMFALGFDLFLQPNHMNVGGVSGAGQLISHVTGLGSVAFWSVLINIPLFLLSFRRVGRSFFWRSLAGMLCLNVFLELFALLPLPLTEPLLAAVCGGLLAGTGGGLVFTAGGSTGGTDVAARLLRPNLPNLPIGKIMFSIDLVIVVLTGLVFRDINKALYSAVTIYVCSIAVDTVVYGVDHCTVALIVSDQWEDIGKRISQRLSRGVTVLEGTGFYSGREKKVLLSVIKKRQVAELKGLVNETDPAAFVILQESHQVLGEGFRNYNKNDL